MRTDKGNAIKVTRRTERARRSPLAVDLKEQVGFLLRKAYQFNMAIWQSLCIDPQLTSVQTAVLAVLHDMGPCSLTTLGREAAMDPATTRGVVDRLRERGLIVLLDDMTDRRKVIAQLVEPGRRLFENMIPALAKISEQTMVRLNPAERVALIFLLRKMAYGPDEEIAGKR